MSVVPKKGWEFIISSHIKFPFSIPHSHTIIGSQPHFWSRTQYCVPCISMGNYMGCVGKEFPNRGRKGSSSVQVGLTSRPTGCWQPQGGFGAREAPLGDGLACWAQQRWSKVHNPSGSLPRILCVCTWVFTCACNVIHPHCWFKGSLPSRQVFHGFLWSA